MHYVRVYSMATRRANRTFLAFSLSLPEEYVTKIKMIVDLIKCLPNNGIVKEYFQFWRRQRGLKLIRTGNVFGRLDSYSNKKSLDD